MCDVGMPTVVHLQLLNEGVHGINSPFVSQANTRQFGRI